MLYSISPARVAVWPLRHIAGRNAKLLARSEAGYHTRHDLKNARPLSITEFAVIRSRKHAARPLAYALTPFGAMFATQASDTHHARMRRSTIIAFTGLPPDVDKEEVKGVFSRCGKVAGVFIRVHQFLKASASGWVEFTSQESVDKALALHNTEIVRRPMFVYALFELPDTIEVGRLPLGIDDDRVKALFASCGQIADIKIHSTLTGQKTGQSYGYVRFTSPTSVSKAIKLNWSMYAGRSLSVRRALQNADDVSIWDNYAETSERTTRSMYICDLPPQVNDDRLKSEFEDCGEIIAARVWRVLSTGRSLGIALLEFASPDSAEKALGATKKIDGQLLRITRALPMRPAALNPIPATEEQPTSIFVGRLADSVDSARLRREFERFGRVVYSRVSRHRDSYKSRGFGFVTFSSPDSVELAIQQDSRLTIDGFSVAISRRGVLPQSSRPGRDVELAPDASTANKDRREARNRADPDPELYDPYDRCNSSDSWEYNY